MASHVSYEILYADDCVLMARSERALQTMMNIFDGVSAQFGQTISTKKTKIMVVDRHRFPLVKKQKGEGTGQVGAGESSRV